MPWAFDVFWYSERVAALSSSAVALYIWLLWRRFSAGPLSSSAELRAEAPARFTAKWVRIWAEVEPIVAHGDEILLIDSGVAIEAVQRADARRDANRDYLAVGAHVKARRQYESRRDRLSAARGLGTHTIEEWLGILRLVRGICPRCERQSVLQKDHVVPLHLGGSDAASNLQPLCKPCNVTKRRETTDWLVARGLR